LADAAVSAFFDDDDALAREPALADADAESLPGATNSPHWGHLPLPPTSGVTASNVVPQCLQ
jgi:hypothetical protein